MRVDYDAIAPRYDRHRGGGGPYMPRLIALAQSAQARHVIELGPGTANNTLPFLAAHPCTLTAVELSWGMLRRGREKAPQVRWVRGGAETIPLAPACAAFLFGVYVLHHIVHLDNAMQCCARVLRPGGAVAFVTASSEYIERHPINRYFPSFAKIDKARFQPVDTVKEAMLRAGFVEVHAERFLDAPKPINRAFADRVAGKFVSTYDLIPADEFSSGLARLYADVDALGQLDEPLQWESVVVSGRIA